ncbi:MAG: hypothetical protein H7145_15810 [Akkermansiaceae bacterium]|nr:hypothetical protein [Armatimonadota bacterium]
MQVSKRWRIWLGICALITGPLLLRDAYQIATNPPVLDAPLASSLPKLADARDEVVLQDGIKVKLIEVRAPIPSGYAAWSPRSTTLPEAAPTLKTWLAGDDRYSGEIDPEKQAYRFAVEMGGLPTGTLRMAISGPDGVTRDAEATHSDWRMNGVGGMTNWLLLPREDRTTDVYAGVALASDRRILAQFPVRGAMGVNHGEEALWMSSPDGWTQPIEIMLPANRRPRITSQYHMEIYELDALGSARLYSQRTVSVSPTTTRLHVNLYGPLRNRNNTRAIRVALTPFRWARFADVPLTIPDAHAARLNPHPISSQVAQVRRAITGSPHDSAFYEVVYAKRTQLSHPQVARYVADSAVISQTLHDAEDLDSAPVPNESYLHVYLPKVWGQNADQMRLTVTTRTGKSLQAFRQNYAYVSHGECFYTHWKVQGIPPGDIDSVLFGLRH